MNHRRERSCACHASRTAIRRRETSSGSEGGLFISNDGRTFFYTPDALVLRIRTICTMSMSLLKDGHS